MNFTQIIILTFLQFFTTFIIAQNIGIHAEPVGEWQTKKTLSPEYHYNSVAVYLLNEDKLKELFEPQNFTSKERKEMGVRYFDELESLYFSLQMANPVREGDSISFPLYAFDINNSKSFSIPRNQGKIIDKVTDEELNGRGLEARARIEAIQKNKLLEVAFQLSSTMNRILEDQIFRTPSMLGVVRKARDYFNSKYKGKIVSEFNIPILPSNEDYEYILQSASLYQIKWNFQPKLQVSGDNVWSSLNDWEVVTEENLKDKPTRLSKLKQHPFLVVLRYKSAYSLPEEHRLNVEISQEYLEKRLVNLQEFKKDGHQYRAEEAFLSMLREAIDLQRKCEDFRRAKEKGEAENETIIQIAQQYFDLLNDFEKELNANSENEEAATYFKEKYEVTYYKFFKLLDNIFFLDEQLKSACQVADVFQKNETEDLNLLDTEMLYDRLEQLENYRKTGAGLTDLEGELFYKVRDKIFEYESLIFERNFQISAPSKEQKIQELETLKKRFELCELCEKEADLQIIQIQQSIDDEIRSELFALQTQQLRLRACFNDIQFAALQNLEKRYPKRDSLTEIETMLVDSYTQKIKRLSEIALNFQPIENLNIQKLSSSKLPEQLQHFENVLLEFRSESCQLKFGGLISDEKMKCLGGKCELIAP